MYRPPEERRAPTHCSRGDGGPSLHDPQIHLTGHHFEFPVNGTYVKEIVEQPEHRIYLPPRSRVRGATTRSGGGGRRTRLQEEETCYYSSAWIWRSLCKPSASSRVAEGRRWSTLRSAHSRLSARGQRLRIQGGRGLGMPGTRRCARRTGRVRPLLREERGVVWCQLSSVAGQELRGPEVVLSWKRLDDSPPRP